MNDPQVLLHRLDRRTEIDAIILSRFIGKMGRFLEEGTGGESSLHKVIVTPCADSAIAGFYVKKGRAHVPGFRRSATEGTIVIPSNTALALCRLARGGILPGNDNYIDVPEGNVRDSAARLRTITHELIHSLEKNRGLTAMEIPVGAVTGYSVWVEGLTEAGTDIFVRPLARSLGLDRADPRFMDALGSAREKCAYLGYVSAVRHIATEALAPETTMVKVIINALGSGDPLAALLAITRCPSGMSQGALDPVAILQELTPLGNAVDRQIASGAQVARNARESREQGHHIAHQLLGTHTQDMRHRGPDIHSL